jgi:AraC family transcriptional regulator
MVGRSAPSAAGALRPSRLAAGAPLLLAGLRRRHRFAEAARAIPAQWAAFGALGVLPGQVGRTAYGVIASSDVAAQSFEYLCGVQVDDLASVPAGLDRMRVPAAQYAVFAHDGHVTTLRETWDRIWREWLPASGMTPAPTPDFERYDERFDPDTGLGGMEIWFPVVRDAARPA